MSCILLFFVILSAKRYRGIIKQLFEERHG